MTLRQLRMFEAVASAGGFGRAARMLGVSQPAVSALVTALERRHDVTLIDRASGTLTPIGAALHEITEEMFDLAERAEQLLEGAALRPSGLVRIASDAPGYLMPLLASVRQAHPDVAFEVVAANATEVLTAVRANDVDFGIAAEVPPDPALHRVRLREQNLAVVVHSGHPLASAKTLRLEKLASESLIGREPGSITRRALESACSAAGFAPRYAMIANSRESVLAGVAAGLGVGVVAEDEMLDDPRLVMLDLRDPLPVTEYLVCRAGAQRSPQWRAVLAAAGRE